MNMVLDALLSLSQKPDSIDQRMQVAELARQSDSLPELVGRWLWLQNRGQDAILELKLWLGFSYRELQELFGYDYREIQQLIRAERLRYLGNYPALDHPQKDNLHGLSCFMVEHKLSEWVDSEWEDSSQLESLHRHLNDCRYCRERLQRYRYLNQEILGLRKCSKKITQQEWQGLNHEVQIKNRKHIMKLGLVLFVVVMSIVALSSLVMMQPEEEPNVFSIDQP